MKATLTNAFSPVLDPMERVSEVLFGLIMALTFTCTFAVATADHLAVRTMLIGALGCNLAWGIIDAGIYLVQQINDQGRKLLLLRNVREATNLQMAQEAIAEELPPLVAATLQPEQLRTLQLKLHSLPEIRKTPTLTKRDFKGALAVCLLTVLSTFPIVIPFLLIGDPRVALRVSNLVAIVMLFGCGYGLARQCGLWPIASGLFMVVLGCLMIGIAIALGG